jgi:hypothetical protein
MMAVRTIGRYACELCDHKPFDTEHGLDVHKIRVHRRHGSTHAWNKLKSKKVEEEWSRLSAKPKKIKKEFTCTDCSASFTTRVALVNHIRFKHSPKFTCDRCPNVSFKTRSGLSSHIRLKHKEETNGEVTPLPAVTVQTVSASPADRLSRLETKIEQIETKMVDVDRKIDKLLAVWA